MSNGLEGHGSILSKEITFSIPKHPDHLSSPPSLLPNGYQALCKATPPATPILLLLVTFQLPPPVAQKLCRYKHNALGFATQMLVAVISNENFLFLLHF
jgi:hypothetical protein